VRGAFRNERIPYSQITPKSLYLNRRRFLAGIPLALAAGKSLAGTQLQGLRKSPLSTDEKPTSFSIVSSYNNFYEFGTAKDQPVRLAQKFRTSPWTVSVEGEVGKKAVYSLDDIKRLAPLEERVYRHRCVEGWSIVVPWIGYSLSEIIKRAEPGPKAKYVQFESYYDPKQMPEAKAANLKWPYVEGLRLDEAMHPLALLCVGMYGESLPNQNGAPVRMVLPWKYGFKSIKSIVKIKLVENEPPATWHVTIPKWYGFYSNVNPDVAVGAVGRWNQTTERRLGELPFFKHDTRIFNGYGDQVARLYAGMDLRKYY
jgi:sulfoxide reductase catalytic subunit YedY